MEARKVKRWALGILIPLVLILLFFWGANYTFSEGSRSGYLYKISKKGLVFKTMEGQLNLGGVKSGQIDVISGNQIWDFSIRGKHGEVYKRLEELQGKYVKLYYREILLNMPWQGDTKYFVYGVEEVQ